MLFSARKHPLTLLSRELRLDILNMIYAAGEGHLGGSLSSIDILISLYFSKIFNFVTDHFILSAGHLAPALYAVLAQAGYFPKSESTNYSEFGSPLQGHASQDTPGVDYSSGSLGQGLSFAAGLALGDPFSHTVCLTSDAEHQEGQTWEAIAFASKYQIKKLINIVDYNRCQIDGRVDDIMPLRNLATKYQEFGWQVASVNGHNFHQLLPALKKTKDSPGPYCLIAQTVLGKGIDFIEDDYHYHDVKNLSAEIFHRAQNQIQKNYS